MAMDLFSILLDGCPRNVLRGERLQFKKFIEVYGFQVGMCMNCSIGIGVVLRSVQ